jgi:quercetin dioxygenase-like cupin family protein
LLPFRKLDIKFNVNGLAEELNSSGLFGKRPYRGMPGSVHEQMKDIWVRYKDPVEHIESGDFSGMADPHESMWLEDIQSIKDIAYSLMRYLEGSSLGGVLVTKLPPGGEIYPHTDDGWHASYYDKYYIPVSNPSGAKFHFNNGSIDPEDGDVYAFRNDVTHWVTNNTNKNRIAMIICIRQNKLTREGLPCHGQQR